MINLVYSIIILSCVLVSLFCMYMLVRNSHVHKVRMAVLKDPSRSTEEILKRESALPSYDRMLWQIFRWNWDDYLDSHDHA